MTKKYFLLLAVLICLSCSNDEITNIENIDDENVINLQLIDYSPKESYTFEEITMDFIEIPDSLEIEVFFGDTKASSAKIANNQVKVNIPMGVDDTFIKLKYNDTIIDVGDINIIKEEDRILLIDYDEKDLFYFDLESDLVGDLLHSYNHTYGGGFSAGFIKKSNVAYSVYSNDCGSSGCYSMAHFKNLENNLERTFWLSGDLGDQFHINLYLLDSNIIFYEDYSLLGMYHEFKSLNLTTMQEIELLDLTQSGVELPLFPNHKIYDEGNNIIYGFNYNSTNDEFLHVKSDLNNFTNNTTLVPYRVRNIVEREDTTVFILKENGIFNLNLLTGEILEPIYEYDSHYKDRVQYSNSTNRYYIRTYDSSNDSYQLKIFNPSTNVITNIESQYDLRWLIIDYE